MMTAWPALREVASRGSKLPNPLTFRQSRRSVISRGAWSSRARIAAQARRRAGDPAGAWGSSVAPRAGRTVFQRFASSPPSPALASASSSRARSVHGPSVSPAWPRTTLEAVRSRRATRREARALGRLPGIDRLRRRSRIRGRHRREPPGDRARRSIRTAARPGRGGASSGRPGRRRSRPSRARGPVAESGSRSTPTPAPPWRGRGAGRVLHAVPARSRVRGRRGGGAAAIRRGVRRRPEARQDLEFHRPFGRGTGRGGGGLRLGMSRPRRRTRARTDAPAAVRNRRSWPPRARTRRTLA